MDISVIFQIILTTIKVLAGLSILVLVHEFGHFLAAIKSGVWVEEFGLGLPPRLWGKKYKNTLYSINALPIGGFVRLHGETRETSKYPEKSFIEKPKKSRIFIALAGIFMNFVLAIVAFSIFYTVQGIPAQMQTGQVEILDVAPDSPAQDSGLAAGDIIKEIAGTKVTQSSQFIQKIDENKGNLVTLVILRPVNNIYQQISLMASLQDIPPEQGALGVSISSSKIEPYFPPLYQRPFTGISYGISDSINLSKAIVSALLGIAGEVSQGVVPEGVYGPVGIFAILAYVANLGILPLINFIGVFSINLAIFNLIPFPPLDGSRVLFVSAEAIVGKKTLPKIEHAVYTAGMIFLLLIFVLMSAREIPQLLKAGSVNNFVESIIPQ